MCSEWCVMVVPELVLLDSRLRGNGGGGVSVDAEEHRVQENKATRDATKRRKRVQLTYRDQNAILFFFF